MIGGDDRGANDSLFNLRSDYNLRSRLNIRGGGGRPESAGSKSLLSERGGAGAASNAFARYANPLSDEKDAGILKKSISYKVGKTIM